MKVVGRRAYFDWGDGKIIAMDSYIKGYKPKNADFTKGKFMGIPKLVDLIDYDGEIIEMNPQDTAMMNPEGHDANQYMSEVWLGKNDKL